METLVRRQCRFDHAGARYSRYPPRKSRRKNRDHPRLFLDWYNKPGPNDGYFEWLRDEAMKRKQPAPQPAKVNYAVGSMEWCREHGVNPEDID
jgi:hypothetical protein